MVLNVRIFPIFYSLFVAITLYKSSLAADCDQYIINVGQAAAVRIDGVCYVVENSTAPGRVDINQAKSDCSNNGGRLAWVETNDLFDKLYIEVDNTGSFGSGKYALVGLIQSKLATGFETGWCWVQSSSIGPNKCVEASQIPWANYQPNDYKNTAQVEDSNEDYGAINSDADTGLGDEPATELYGFICEYEFIPYDPICDHYIINTGNAHSLHYNSRCYVIEMSSGTSISMANYFDSIQRLFVESLGTFDPTVSGRGVLTGLFQDPAAVDPTEGPKDGWYWKQDISLGGDLPIDASDISSIPWLPNRPSDYQGANNLEDSGEDFAGLSMHNNLAAGLDDMPESKFYAYICEYGIECTVITLVKSTLQATSKPTTVFNSQPSISIIEDSSAKPAVSALSTVNRPLILSTTDYREKVSTLLQSKIPLKKSRSFSTGGDTTLQSEIMSHAPVTGENTVTTDYKIPLSTQNVITTLVTREIRSSSFTTSNEEFETESKTDGDIIQSYSTHSLSTQLNADIEMLMSTLDQKTMKLGVESTANPGLTSSLSNYESSKLSRSTFAFDPFPTSELVKSTLMTSLHDKYSSSKITKSEHSDSSIIRNPLLGSLSMSTLIGAKPLKYSITNSFAKEYTTKPVQVSSRITEILFQETSLQSRPKTIATKQLAEFSRGNYHASSAPNIKPSKLISFDTTVISQSAKSIRGSSDNTRKYSGGITESLTITTISEEEDGAESTTNKHESAIKSSPSEDFKTNTLHLYLFSKKETSVGNINWSGTKFTSIFPIQLDIESSTETSYSNKFSASSTKQFILSFDSRAKSTRRNTASKSLLRDSSYEKSGSSTDLSTVSTQNSGRTQFNTHFNNTSQYSTTNRSGKESHYYSTSTMNIWLSRQSTFKSLFLNGTKRQETRERNTIARSAAFQKLTTSQPTKSFTSAVENKKVSTFIDSNPSIISSLMETSFIDKLSTIDAVLSKERTSDSNTTKYSGDTGLPSRSKESFISSTKKRNSREYTNSGFVRKEIDQTSPATNHNSTNSPDDDMHISHENSEQNFPVTTIRIMTSQKDTSSYSITSTSKYSEENTVSFQDYENDFSAKPAVVNPKLSSVSSNKNNDLSTLFAEDSLPLDNEADCKSLWASWSTCSVTCGQGFEFRTRKTTNDTKCVGKTTQSRPCAAEPCKIDCAWSKWFTWTPCSAKCKQISKQTRKRRLLVIENKLGVSCKENYEEQRQCVGDCIDEVLKPEIKQILNDSDVNDEVIADQTALSTSLTDSMSYVLSGLSDDVRKEIGHQLNEMVPLCTFDGVPCEMDDFTHFIDATHGNCYTYNFGTHPKSNSYTSGKQHGLSVLLQSSQSDYVCSTSSAGFRIQIHNNTEYPFPGNLGNNVKPGTVTEIGLLKTYVSKLGEPFGNCSLGDTPTIYNATYTVEACLRGCIQNLMNKYCGCGDPKFPSSDGVTPCTIKEKKCIDYFRICGNDLLDMNKCGCRSPCQNAIFDRVSTEAKLNTHHDLVGTFCAEQSTNFHQCVHEISLNFALLRIYYERLNVYAYVDEEAFDVFQLLASIGSIAGVVLSISFITMFELIEFGIEF